MEDNVSLGSFSHVLFLSLSLSLFFLFSSSLSGATDAIKGGGARRTPSVIDSIAQGVTHSNDLVADIGGSLQRRRRRKIYRSALWRVSRRLSSFFFFLRLFFWGGWGAGFIFAFSSRVAMFFLSESGFPAAEIGPAGSFDPVLTEDVKGNGFVDFISFRFFASGAFLGPRAYDRVLNGWPPRFNKIAGVIRTATLPCNGLYWASSIDLWRSFIQVRARGLAQTGALAVSANSVRMLRRRSCPRVQDVGGRCRFSTPPGCWESRDCREPGRSIRSDRRSSGWTTWIE